MYCSFASSRHYYYYYIIIIIIIITITITITTAASAVVGALYQFSHVQGSLVISVNPKAK